MSRSRDIADLGGGITQADLPAEGVNESKLQVSNAPVNGYALTAQSGNTGGMTWAEMAAGATTLISTTTVTSNVGAVDIALPTGYSVFELFLEAVTPSTSGQASTLSARFSYDNGVSYNSNSSAYYSNGTYRSEIHLHGSNDFNNASFLHLQIQGANTHPATDTIIRSTAVLETGTGNVYRDGFQAKSGAFTWVTATPVDHIKIFPLGGGLDISGGTFKLYGRVT